MGIPTGYPEPYKKPRQWTPINEPAPLDPNVNPIWQSPVYTGGTNAEPIGSTPTAAPIGAAPTISASTVSGSRGDSVGGISAVNPQAGQMDYDSLTPFINSAYDSAMTRLQPQIDQSRDRFDQNMVNRGIPVGGEAYNEAFQQQDQNINDALTNANFNAMQFGTGIQNQMFGQDMGRSQLANSLLQARERNQLGYRGIGENARQFDASLGENQRQFDDTSSRAWDALTFGQMMGLDDAAFRNQAYGDSRSDYSDSLLMAMLGMPTSSGPQYNYDPNGPYGAQLGFGANNYGNWANMWGNMVGGAQFGGGG